MGLDTKAKGLSDADGFHCGYISYGRFLEEVVKVAYGDECLRIWEKITNGNEASEEEAKTWNQVCRDGLDILLFHSDCDGKFTPTECRMIYAELAPLQSKLQGHNYGDMVTYNMFEHWKKIFKHCADRRVNLYYT